MWKFIGVLMLFNLSVSYAKTHSLQYFYTATSEISNFPEVIIVGMVDEGQIVYYDSITHKAVPKQDWVNKAADPQYWERNTGNFLSFEQISKVDLNTLKQRFNYTGGVHTFQDMYGCEWDDQTGATNGFDQYGYDGEDFLTLDLKDLRWVSPVQQAMITTQNWNNDRANLEFYRNYYTTECIEWLQKYVEYGKSSLEKTVSPQVSLLQKSSSSPVVCHATGFYPSGIKISWQKNEQDHDEDVELGELLPNSDRTFQKTSTLNIKPEEWKKNKFSCVVEHQSKTINSILTEDEIRTNNPSTPLGIIIGIVVAAVLLVVIAVAGFVVYRKKNGFKPVSGSDDGSNSSTHTVPKA